MSLRIVRLVGTFQAYQQRDVGRMTLPPYLIALLGMAVSSRAEADVQAHAPALFSAPILSTLHLRFSASILSTHSLSVGNKRSLWKAIFFVDLLDLFDSQCALSIVQPTPIFLLMLGQPRNKPLQGRARRVGLVRPYCYVSLVELSAERLLQ